MRVCVRPEVCRYQALLSRESKKWLGGFLVNVFLVHAGKRGGDEMA
jgi:hypothetical protein